jgi:hypothetical protein
LDGMVETRKCHLDVGCIGLETLNSFDKFMSVECERRSTTGKCLDRIT